MADSKKLLRELHFISTILCRVLKKLLKVTLVYKGKMREFKQDQWVMIIFWAYPTKYGQEEYIYILTQLRNIIFGFTFSTKLDSLCKYTHQGMYYEEDTVIDNKPTGKKIYLIIINLIENCNIKLKRGIWIVQIPTTKEYLNTHLVKSTG